MEFYKEETSMFNDEGNIPIKRIVTSEKAPLIRKERNHRLYTNDISVFPERSFQGNVPVVMIPGFKPEV